MQYRKKSNYEIISQALREAGREDLIGFSQECLIKPTKEQAIARSQSENRAASNAKHFSKGSAKQTARKESNKEKNKSKPKNVKGGRKA